MNRDNENSQPAAATVKAWRVRSAPALCAVVGHQTNAAENAAATAFDGVVGLGLAENALDEFIDSLDVAVFITDVQGQIVKQNTAAGQFTDFALQPTSAIHIADVLYTPLNDDLREIESTLRDIVVAGHAARRLGLPIALSSGELAVIDYDLRPLLNHEQELIGGVVIARQLSQVDDL